MINAITGENLFYMGLVMCVLKPQLSSTVLEVRSYCVSLSLSSEFFCVYMAIVVVVSWCGFLKYLIKISDTQDSGSVLYYVVASKGKFVEDRLDDVIND